MIEGLNRAFLYGESVFTTLKMVNGEVKDWELHFDRLKRGVEYVYGPFTDTEWIPLLKNRLEASCQLETGDKVLRFTIYRRQERGLRRTGLLSEADLKINFHSTPFDPERTKGRSVKLRTCAAFPRPHWWPSYLKAGSYFDVIMAQKVFLKSTDDDLLFLAPDDTIYESSVANIFVVNHDKLYTAPTGPNVLEGIMRKKILKEAPKIFQDCIETGTSVDQAMRADGVFGSNSVRGPFLVHSIDGHEIAYSKEFLDKFERLQELVL